MLALWMVGSLPSLLLLVGDGLGTPIVGPVIAIGHLGMLLVPLVLLARKGNPVHLLGLDRFDLRALMLTGAATIAAFVFSILYGLLLLQFDQQAQEPIVPLFGSGAASLLSMLVAVGIWGPLVEEIVFRGFLYLGLLGRFSPTGAAVVSGLLFGAVHLQPLAFPLLVILGILLALLYHHSRTLWAPILMHVVINSTTVLVQVMAGG